MSSYSALNWRLKGFIGKPLTTKRVNVERVAKLMEDNIDIDYLLESHIEVIFNMKGEQIEVLRIILENIKSVALDKRERKLILNLIDEEKNRLDDESNAFAELEILERKF
jgi:aspartate/glutamate racemase